MSDNRIDSVTLQALFTQTDFQQLSKPSENILVASLHLPAIRLSYNETMAEPKSDRVNAQLTWVPSSIDEKHTQTSPHFGSGQVSERQIPEQTWTDAEEKAAVRKADFIVMPLLMFAFFVLQLDRSNAGNALTDGFLKDIGITQNQFNVGMQLLNAGIILLEIPSNIVLYRVGPKIWLSCQIVAW